MDTDRIIPESGSIILGRVRSSGPAKTVRRLVPVRLLHAEAEGANLSAADIGGSVPAVGLGGSPAPGALVIAVPVGDRHIFLLGAPAAEDKVIRATVNLEWPWTDLDFNTVRMTVRGVQQNISKVITPLDMSNVTPYYGAYEFEYRIQKSQFQSIWNSSTYDITISGMCHDPEVYTAEPVSPGVTLDLGELTLTGNGVINCNCFRTLDAIRDLYTTDGSTVYLPATLEIVGVGSAKQDTVLSSQAFAIIRTTIAGEAWRFLTAARCGSPGFVDIQIDGGRYIVDSRLPGGGNHPGGQTSEHFVFVTTSQGFVNWSEEFRMEATISIDEAGPRPMDIDIPMEPAVIRTTAADAYGMDRTPTNPIGSATVRVTEPWRGWPESAVYEAGVWPPP